MDAKVVEQTVETIVARLRPWLSQMVTQAASSGTPEALANLERAFRDGSQEQVRLAYQDVLLSAAAGDAGRVCPHCQTRRRHKGRRARKVLTSVGHVAIDGVCWQCPDVARGGCGRHEHASACLGLAGSVTTTAPMRELICLLGLSQGSFAHAGLALDKLMGLTLSTPTIAAMCEEEGRRIEASVADDAAPHLVEGTLVGSCDGTMVNTREEGWRELRSSGGGGSTTTGADAAAARRWRTPPRSRPVCGKRRCAITPIKCNASCLSATPPRGSRTPSPSTCPRPATTSSTSTTPTSTSTTRPAESTAKAPTPPTPGPGTGATNSTSAAARPCTIGCDTHATVNPTAKSPWINSWASSIATPTAWTTPATAARTFPSAAAPWKAPANNWADDSKDQACAGAPTTSPPWPTS